MRKKTRGRWRGRERGRSSHYKTHRAVLLSSSSSPVCLSLGTVDRRTHSNSKFLSASHRTVQIKIFSSSFFVERDGGVGQRDSAVVESFCREILSSSWAKGRALSGCWSVCRVDLSKGNNQSINKSCLQVPRRGRPPRKRRLINTMTLMVWYLLNAL